MVDRPKQDTQRADRILDAAAALLPRLGYRKVTIEDVARQAGIGKGTVYLHWRTKDQLFEALMLRESAAVMAELVDRVREDPAEILPHRIHRATFLLTLRNPIMLALFTGNAELLGKLKDSALRKKDLLASERFYDLMVRRGLLRDDVPNLSYAVGATITGFYLIEDLVAGLGLDERDGPFAGIDLEAKADALARTVRHAFEPAGPAAPEAVAATAAELVAMYEELLASYRDWIYSPESSPGPG